MENVLNIVKTAALAVCVLYTLFGIGTALYTVVLHNKKASERKQQIEIGKSVNDRFKEIQFTLDQMKIELESMRKVMRKRYNKNAGKIKRLEKAVDEKFELLNKQPEQKKDDSAIGGILSGILSGALSGVLANVLFKNSKESENKKEAEQSSNDCYGIQNKATGEILEQRFDGYYSAFKWLHDNNLSTEDYDIGIIKKTETKPDENQEKESNDVPDKDQEIKVKDISD